MSVEQIGYAIASIFTLATIAACAHIILWPIHWRGVNAYQNKNLNHLLVAGLLVFGLVADVCLSVQLSYYVQPKEPRAMFVWGLDVRAVLIASSCGVILSGLLRIMFPWHNRMLRRVAHALALTNEAASRILGLYTMQIGGFALAFIVAYFG